MERAPRRVEVAVPFDIPQARGMVALGMLFNEEMSSRAAMGHRLAKAAKAWWRDVRLYMCRAIPLIEKLQRYTRRVQGVVLDQGAA
eukprot:2428728-Lingulodinium_polyedra.AAC.1